MPPSKKSGSDRSKVKRAGRTVGDPEVLEAEHDALLLELHACVAAVCDRLFGLSQEKLKGVQDKHLAEGRKLAKAAHQRLVQLLEPDFRYARWMNPYEQKEKPELAQSAPAQAVLTAARKAGRFLAKLAGQQAPLDLYDATLVQITKASIRGELTSTTYRDFRDKKVDELGYVDLCVRYRDAAEIEALLLTNGQPVELGFVDAFRERSRTAGGSAKHHQGHPHWLPVSAMG